MSPDNTTGTLIALIIVALIGGLVSLAWYLWYALALAKLFPKLGGAAWKGWVPIINESEILARGGVAAWKVIFFFLPIVSLYGLYLKITAVHRIDKQFGRGAGSTVLGILLPPVWASVLAWGREPGGNEFERRVASIALPPEREQGPLAEPVPYPPAVPAPPVAQPVVFDQPPAPPTVPVQSPAPIAFADNPWAPKNVGPLVPKAAAAPPAPPPPAPAAPAPAPVAAPAPALATAQDDDDLDRTVVVDRRPTVSWSLVLDDGRSFLLEGAHVALGRNPAAADGVEALVLPDESRTLSKTHARIDLNDGEWTITDLNSTNGVLVVKPDGTELVLDPGIPVPFTGRFVLGHVGMTVVYSEGAR